GVLSWPQATRLGFLAGLTGGIAVWGYALLLPLLERSGFLHTGLSLPSLHHSFGMEQWQFATFWSLTCNGLLFVGVSLITRQSPEEKDAARACRSDVSLSSALKGVVAAGTTQQFTQGLAEIVGQDTAEQEVKQALEDLGMAADEIRPGELRRLREQIERNLSGLLGPQMAHIIINRQLAMDSEAKTALADSIRHIEEQLESSRTQLKGLSADMDTLRRFHRQILLDLPLGVCAVTPDHRVVVWNLAMEILSGVPSRQVVGYRLNALPAPWGDLLAGFALAQDKHIPHMEVAIENRPHWFNLHKATIPDPQLGASNAESRTGLVMLLEDLTDLETLEAELAHSDRLASIGRLAAGVAHEIGNPITGIASLAQNLRDEKEPEIIEESISCILQQTKRISSIIGSLMNFSRSGSIGSDYQTFKLKQTIDDAISLVKLARSGKQVEYNVSCRKKLRLVGDRQRISQVLVNLLANACDASKPGDRIEIIASQDDEYVQLELMDQGQGIPEQDQNVIFEPFFTTKKPGEGTGLGLSMVYKIIQEHQGEIKIDSVPGTGTRVVVRLPQHRDQQEHEADIDH
ncbi:MAG: GHKL domain-containing protein, partial [Gammaproteobacteria bacterium]|nr:GHKL domain-containing protein [Gammaproteobacteria bacterium]